MVMLLVPGQVNRESITPFISRSLLSSLQHANVKPINQLTTGEKSIQNVMVYIHGDKRPTFPEATRKSNDRGGPHRTWALSVASGH